MKVEVYCRHYGPIGAEGAIPEKTIWRGEMDSVPRIGEIVHLSGDWSGEEVRAVSYNLSTGAAYVELNTDYDNEYPELPDANA